MVKWHNLIIFCSLKFGVLDGRYSHEHNGIGIMKMYIFVMQDKCFFGIGPFDETCEVFSLLVFWLPWQQIAHTSQSTARQ